MLRLMLRNFAKREFYLVQTYLCGGRSYPRRPALQSLARLHVDARGRRRVARARFVLTRVGARLARRVTTRAAVARGRPPSAAPAPLPALPPPAADLRALFSRSASAVQLRAAKGGRRGERGSSPTNCSAPEEGASVCVRAVDVARAQLRS